MSHSDKAEAPVTYESTVVVESRSYPGVTFTVTRMSFGRRMELFRRIRELAMSLPYLEASGDFREQIEASVLAQQIENLYLEWGLEAVRGLSIDGEPCTPQSLAARGPEALAREIVEAVKAQCGLNEEERKN